jgi:hypothetical protein
VSLCNRIENSLPNIGNNFVTVILDLIQEVCDGIGREKWTKKCSKLVACIFQIMKNSNRMIVVRALKVLASLTFDNDPVIGLLTAQSVSTCLLHNNLLLCLDLNICPVTSQASGRRCPSRDSQAFG